jgi:hypothetical protein
LTSGKAGKTTGQSNENDPETAELFPVHADTMQLYLFVLILILGIRSEDKFPFRTLKGYREYLQKVRYRFIPGIRYDNPAFFDAK